MVKLGGIAIVVFVSQFAYAQTRSAELHPGLSGTTMTHGLDANDTPLGALIKFGVQNQVPLGIVIEGSSLCIGRLSGEKRQVTIADVTRQIETQVPGYTAEIRDRTFFVHPKVMAPSTHKVLGIVVPRFYSSSATVETISISLWMYIRAVLVPGEGSGFVGGSQRDAETLPAFEVSGENVQGILNRLVSTKAGGLWTMHKVPDDWIAHPATIPFDILSYTGDLAPATSINCSAD